MVLSRVELTGGHDRKVQPHEGTLGPSKGCSGSRVAPALEWAWVRGVVVVCASACARAETPKK